MTQYTRRRLITVGLGAATVGTLAGCTSNDVGSSTGCGNGPEVQSSFFVSEHNLQYVCSDPLESQKAANQLVAETDATEVLPLTPLPEQTQEWIDNDWGYVEIMESVNLGTLKKALGAA
ncbi:zinc ABC transporter substrate-binding protein [Haloferax elongans ATCC BAA-1513]|uniref:Zinc ABC transporter substrate-binding protein n=1 Tax=Haloferax elongans ATCC BAA-1513 TaxID=1230453 RepID=M0I0U7_HALEO|nr:zinc ABC transporter substrate-binding protein [Haloferax elongans ATCC BAA-1513]